MTVTMVFYHRKQHFSNVVKALHGSSLSDRVFVITSDRNRMSLTDMLEKLKASENTLDCFVDYGDVEFIVENDDDPLIDQMVDTLLDDDVRGSMSDGTEVDVTYATPAEMMDVCQLSALLDVSIYRLVNGEREVIPPFPRPICLDPVESEILARMYSRVGHSFRRADVVSELGLSDSMAHRKLTGLIGKGLLESVPDTETRNRGRREFVYTVKRKGFFMSLLNSRARSGEDGRFRRRCDGPSLQHIRRRFRSPSISAFY